MKTFAALALALAAAATLAVANRSVELSTLAHLQALDGSALCGGTKTALTWINENALEHLPVAATLRAENVVAGIALHFGSETIVVATR